MRLGMRARLFAASLLLASVVGLASGLYLERALRSWLEARIESELMFLTRTCRQLVETAPGASSLHEMDRLADRLGRSSGARVTIIAGDGTVLGDSGLTLAQVREIENHGGRPEVLAAIKTGRGSSRRYSTTLRTSELYVAARYRRDKEKGVIRLAVPLSEVDAAVGRLRLLLLVGGLLGLALAVVVGGAASHLLSRRVRDLVAHVREIAHAKAGKLPLPRDDELSRLAGSFNRLLEELDRSVSDLAAERDRLETILESMSDAVLALDREQRVTMANQAALDLLRLSSPPLGRTLLEVVRVPALVELVKKSKHEPTASAEFELSGRTSRRVLAVAAPQRTAGGLVLVMHDVSEMRRLERVRRDFVANVSHELRTPVSVVQASAETLLGGALEDRDRAREFLEAIHRNATRLSSVISDLLDLSRIESGQLVMEMREVPLIEVVDRAVQSVREPAGKKGIFIENAVEPSTRVRADEKALEHVLLNLLDNAVKYGEQGGRVVTRSAARNGMVRVEVRDDGPGIEPQHRGRVFERFYRVDPGRSREIGGTGLGLSIVRNLVNAMDGKVGFEPAEPRGSIFWFTVPAAGPKESAEREPDR
jgi:two-component system phosphate regulon sensor histidine kinase PhoR